MRTEACKASVALLAAAAFDDLVFGFNTAFIMFSN